MSHHLLASAFQRIGSSSHTSLKVDNGQDKVLRGRGWGSLKPEPQPEPEPEPVSVAIYCQLAASHSKAINFLLDYIKFTNDLSMPWAVGMSPSPPSLFFFFFFSTFSTCHFPFPFPLLPISFFYSFPEQPAEIGWQRQQDISVAFNATNLMQLSGSNRIILVIQIIWNYSL